LVIQNFLKIIVQAFLIYLLSTSMLRASEAVHSPVADVPPVAAISEAPDKAKAIEQQDNLILLKHKPIYFLYGKPDTKAQFSFKSPIVQRIPFYFAYSQIVFWRLHEESKPFTDATYNPEMFYRWSFRERSLFSSIDFGPWEHNSNGKDAETSRSFDRTYVKVNLAQEWSNWVGMSSVKVFHLYNQDETNQDIYKYISPVEFSLSLIQLQGGMIDKSELALRFFPGGRWADRWDRGGYEVGYSFRLGGLDLFPALSLQYYQGYAETLINYDRYVRQFRAGISF
jgi:phospholipase A1